jgi:hypothetical protein
MAEMAEVGEMAGGEMAEASSATTNHGDSAARVLKEIELFTAQQHEPQPRTWRDRFYLNRPGGLSHSAQSYPHLEHLSTYLSTFWKNGKKRAIRIDYVLFPIYT